MKKYYGINYRIVYASFKVKNYFSLKCKSPMSLLANVVYRFKYLHDVDTTYIGKTKRHLATRVKEHGHSNSTSAIHDHMSDCKACQSHYSCGLFQVIDTGSNDLEITIKEALHIKMSKSKLNRQLFCQGSSFVLNVF